MSVGERSTSCAVRQSIGRTDLLRHVEQFDRSNQMDIGRECRRRSFHSLGTLDHICGNLEQIRAPPKDRELTRLLTYPTQLT